MSWGHICWAIAALVFFALAIHLFAIDAKGVDWNFLAHFFLCLGLILAGLPVVAIWRRPAP